MRMIKWFSLTAGLLGLVAGCGTWVAGGHGRTMGAQWQIMRTNFLGSLWSQACAQAAVVSQDGGESYAVPGGAVWAFGDTFKGSRAADGKPHFVGGAVSCAIARLDKNARTYPPAFEYRVGADGTVASPFAYLPEEQPVERYRIWPLGGIYLNGHYYIYYSLIEVFGGGVWDFRGVASGLGRSDTALGAYTRLRPRGDWRFPVEPDQVIAADGWIYLLSIGTFDHRQGAGLARVRPAAIEEPEAYEFYAGAGPKFSTRKGDAVCLVRDVPGQVSVAWNAYLRKYLLAASSDFDHPRQICLREADAVFGPWGPPVARIQVPAERQGKRVELVYCAYLHPELFRENGRIMNLTYSLGLKDAGFDANCEMVEVEVRENQK